MCHRVCYVNVNNLLYICLPNFKESRYSNYKKNSVYQYVTTLHFFCTTKTQMTDVNSNDKMYTNSMLINRELALASDKYKVNCYQKHRHTSLSQHNLFENTSIKAICLTFISILNTSKSVFLHVVSCQ